MKYELENVIAFGDEWFVGQVKVLTGLGYDEIRIAHNKNKFTGQGTIQMFRDLGFNVSSRWVKFDAETQYPAMIRCKSFYDKSHWYPFVYYDGKVYAPHHGGRYDSVECFLDSNKEFKITSMIQVWI